MTQVTVRTPRADAAKGTFRGFDRTLFGLAVVFTAALTLGFFG